MKINILFLLIVLVLTKFVNTKKRCKQATSNASTTSKPSNNCPPKEIGYEDPSLKTDCFPYLDSKSDQDDLEESSSGSQSISNFPCIDCQICMCVVERLSKELHLKSKPKYIWNKKDPHNNLNLIELCSSAFQKYEYQECKGKQFIGPLKSESKAIPTGDKEAWSEKLKDKCYILVEFYGKKNIFRDWQMDQNSLSKGLCRGNGVFGSCNLINENQLKLRKDNKKDDIDNDDDDDDNDADDDNNIKYVRD